MWLRMWLEVGGTSYVFSTVWQIRANFVSWFLDVVDSSQVRCWQFFPAEEACSFCWNSQALAFDLFQGYARSNLSNAWNWNWADWSWFGMWHIWTAWNIHFAYDFAPGIGLDIPSLEMREGTRHRFETNSSTLKSIISVWDLRCSSSHLCFCGDCMSFL